MKLCKLTGKLDMSVHLKFSSQLRSPVAGRNTTNGHVDNAFATHSHVVVAAVSITAPDCQRPCADNLMVNFLRSVQPAAIAVLVGEKQLTMGESTERRQNTTCDSRRLLQQRSSSESGWESCQKPAHIENGRYRYVVDECHTQQQVHWITT